MLSKTEAGEKKVRLLSISISNFGTGPFFGSHLEKGTIKNLNSRLDSLK